MSWLDDLNNKRVYHYETEEGARITGTLPDINEELGLNLEGDPGETFEFEGELYTRGGFEPIKINLATRVFYEKNGRKAYKIGNDYVSATKEQYMRTGETSTVLSSSYKKHLDSKIDDAMNFYEKDQKRFEKSKTKGSVSFSKTIKKS